ncbi:hypothetical protein [Streptosporangium sp. NPDC000396]
MAGRASALTRERQFQWCNLFWLLERVTGTVLIGFGLRLAMEGR